ncbi:MAG: endo-1,4-beta-xylanase [Bacteroidetes bacterium]|nr:endo-1,4-beta-xylanase [Bacteroidota bacterium]
MKNGLTAFLFFLSVILFSCKKEKDSSEENTTLKAIARYPIGNTYRTNGRDFYTWGFPNKSKQFGKTGFAERPPYFPALNDEILQSEFSSITPETCLKMHTVSVDSVLFNFTEADQMVAYAKTHQMRIHGHVLLWSSSVPEWIRHVQWTEGQYERWLEFYIKTVVGRYKNDILAWDVVNEPLVPFFGTDLKAREDNFWRYHIGDDYMEKAFKWAEEASPTALLFLNEVGAESSFNVPRRKKVIEIANDLRNKGLKVDGIGLQFHLISPDIDDKLMQSIATDIAGNDYLFHISELDIQMNFPLGLKNKLTPEDATKLKQSYNTIVYNYTKYVPKAQQYGITMWGISDTNTFCTLYINLRLKQQSEDFPHLWDANYKKKEAYFGVIDGLKGVKGRY